MMVNGAQNRGFTLIELVMVVVILGIVGFGVSNFMRTGTQIYVDVTERDALLSESRFVVERLNRELRNALPNSIRVAGDSAIHCLEFVPVVWSTYYFDIPVFPETAASQISVVEPESSFFVQDEHEVVVYPTQTSDVYSDTSARRYSLDSKLLSDSADNKVDLDLDVPSDVQFAADSPSSRLYVVENPVSYCMSNGQIRRHTGYGFNFNQVTAPNDGVLMAENAANTLSASAGEDIGDPFRVIEPSLLRNSAIIAMLQFESGGERISFSNEVHLPNAP